MGIFDRIAKGIEQNNVDAVYSAELDRLDARIAEHTDRLASLRADERVKAQRGDGSEAGYAELIAEATAILEKLHAQRRQLDQERLSAPAKKAVAEARVAIDDQSSGVGASATAQGLTRIRDEVAALNRRASPGYLDADGIPIHGRLEKMKGRSSQDKARDELARMKAEMGLGPPVEPANEVPETSEVPIDPPDADDP